ncbi:DUF5017 domain-containing protein [Paraflavisolibacter sp. H34]|uniref:DUF5017 domain-containing protein n=1 Tax=Huijunlia imazamoxiresistens TaxID=3127457 RepID=UPI00301B2BA2
MRINPILVAATLVSLGLASCAKQMELKSLSFEVAADSASYNAGSTTNFTFSGNPDYLTFFSGEPGRNYAFKDRVQAAGTPVLNFKSALNAGAQPGSLALLVSTDFAGGVNATSDPAALAAATWTDITNRATLAANGTAVSSGNIDLSEFAAAGKPVYIAFKYKADAGSIQNKWTLTSLSLRNNLADGSSFAIDSMPTLTTVVNYGNTGTMPGWAGKTVANSYNWALAAASMTITGAATAAAATAPAEAWAITGPVDLKKVTPDAGVVVKSMADFKPNYLYNYAKPGAYPAVFVASNANIEKGESVTRSLTITVK